MDVTIICIDETRKSIPVEPRSAHKPCCRLSNSQNNVTGISTGCDYENGECFFSRFKEYVTANAQIISFSNYIMNSKMIGYCLERSAVLSGVGAHEIGDLRRPRLRHTLCIHRNSTLSNSAGDDSKALSATDSSYRLTN